MNEKLLCLMEMGYTDLDTNIAALMENSESIEMACS
jgi:hypothetical protein